MSAEASESDTKFADTVKPGEDPGVPCVALADERDGDIRAAFRVRHQPGHALVFAFDGFGVVVTPDGSALVMTKAVRNAAVRMGDREDRLLCAVDDSDARRRALDDIAAAVWPKNEVP